MDKKIILQIVNHSWYIHPAYADSYALIAHQVFTGTRQSFFDDDDDEPTEYAWLIDINGKRIGAINDVVENATGTGAVAVIQLQGAVMKYDSCGAPGTQSLAQALQDANDNPSVAAILLEIDSPGGSVDGTQKFADAVKNSAKPVVAWVNGMMCSAAMWIGSAAQKRIASSNTDTIGSIGTMASWRDFSGYYDKMGIKSHEVYATDSTQKNLPFREAMGKNEDGKSNYEPLIKTWLDPLNAEFTGSIKNNLPGADESVLNGAAYIATDAIAKGLIDAIGTFQSAIQQAFELAQPKQNLQSQKSNSMKWTKIRAFLGLPDASTAADIKLEDKHVDSMESLVVERDTLKTEKETLTQQLADANAAKTTAQTSLTTANTRITELEAQVAALGKEDGAKLTETPGGKKEEASAVNEFETSYDREWAKRQAILNQQK